MLTRVSMVFLTMVLAIISLLIAAKNPTGPNTVSFDEPIILWLSIGTLVVLFLPPFVLSFFNHLAVKIISAIYQGFIVISFIGIALVGVFVPVFSVMIVGILGAVVGICSVIVTILVGLNKKNVITN